jgi:hypothetical protein
MTTYVAGNIDLYISAGVAFTKQITIRDSNFVPLNISNFNSVSTKVSRYYQDHREYPMISTIIDANIGLIEVGFLQSVTETFIFDRYVFSVFLTDNTETVEMVSGQILMLTF